MRTILFFLFVICISSCQDNFDEIKDSSHRSITLRIATDNQFSNVLLYHEGKSHLGADRSLVFGKRLRVVTYCYNDKGVLLRSETRLSEHLTPVEVTFKHLLKDESYHFIIISDIVEYDANVGYYETWYQLETASLDLAYMTFFSQNEDIKSNSVMFSSFIESPSNQSIDVILSPVTYNGFVILENTKDIYYVRLAIDQGKSCFLSNIKRKERIFVPYEFSFPNGEEIVVPITTCKKTGSISLELTIINQEGMYDKVLRFSNDASRPFIARIDSKTMNFSNLDFY